MDLPGHEGELPVPVTSTYVGDRGHLHTTVEDPFPPPTSAGEDRTAGDGQKGAVAVSYRECLKNHAAAIGGTALDGCGEFMPGGEEGTLEALRCSACSCHRNFHRKEVDGELPRHHHFLRKVVGHNGVLISASDARGYFSENPSGGIFSARPLKGFSEKCSLTAAGVLSTENGLFPGHPQHAHHHMVMPLGALRSSEYFSDNMEGAGGGLLPTAAVAKKRFRTKFTPEQKEKMLNFAEKAGWRLQRQEESVVERFCQEVGVKRRVLKVWMHNNKHSLGKKEANPLQLE